MTILIARIIFPTVECYVVVKKSWLNLCSAFPFSLFCLLSCSSHVTLKFLLLMFQSNAFFPISRCKDAPIPATFDSLVASTWTNPTSASSDIASSATAAGE